MMGKKGASGGRREATATTTLARKRCGRAATPQQCIQMGQFHAVNNALDGVREALDLLKNVSVDNDSPIRNLNFDTNGNGKKILAFKCLC